MIHWGWVDDRGKRDNSRFPATERGIKLGGLYLKSNRRGMDPPSAYLLPWEKLQLG